MADIFWFTKLMKSEPKLKKKKRNVWVIDESKCLNKREITTLRVFCNKQKTLGLEAKRFRLVRDWFMVELGLNAGLRVDEMAHLQHQNLFIEGTKSSIVVTGKGEKKRVVWISSQFKKTCITYISYKKMFGFNINGNAYLLNSQKDNIITKRSLQKFFKEILELSHLPSRYYIHCLRHTYATFLLEETNHDYRFTQKQLGHASIKTTQVYAGILVSKRKRDLERLFR